MSNYPAVSTPLKHLFTLKSIPYILKTGYFQVKSNFHQEVSHTVNSNVQLFVSLHPELTHGSRLYEPVLHFFYF